MTRSRLGRYQLPIFFVLAYAITWPVHVAAFTYAHNHGQTVTNEANVLSVGRFLQGDLDPGYVPFLLLFMFVFGPTVAGVIVTALFKGRAGLVDLFRRTTKVRIPSGWIALILVLPIVHAVASVAVGFLLGGMEPLRYSFLTPLSLMPALLLYMIVCTGLAEEIGWRGYALPELQTRYTAERSSWILGIAWGLWHIPVNLYPPFLRGELTPALAIPLLAAMIFGTVGYTIVLTWIYNNTNSVFWIVILHGWGNTVQSYVVLSSGSYMAQVAYAVLPWALAAYVLKRYGAETLTQREPAVPLVETPPAAT
jgi:hypothetical protein